MRHLIVFVTFSGFLLAGCGANSTAGPTSSTPTAPATSHAHSHSSEGPHHGAMVELGSEEFHAEVVHTGDTATVYVLGSTAKSAVPIDASDVTINVVSHGKPEQYKLLASPESSDPAGKASRFALQDADLVAHLNDASAAVKLAVTIDGTPYSGEVPHVHDHAAHDH